MHINFLLFFQPKESNPEIVQVMPLICDHPSVISECKSQLRESQDEVYQLKNQIIKLKLDLKSKSDDIQRFESKHEVVENHNLELSSTNQKLMQKNREFEADIQSSTRSKLVAEQSLGILQSERESLVKSRNWYRDQMHATQDSKSELQRSLIDVQADFAGKVTQIEQLKIDLLQSNKTLEEERHRALQEKESLKSQLEDFIGSPQLEQDDGIINNNNDLKIQNEILKDEIRGYESRIEILGKKLKEAIEANEIMQKDYEENKLKVHTLNEELEEIVGKEKMFVNELEAKSELIENLKDEKLNTEMSCTRLKNELDEMRQSWFNQVDLNKEIKNESKNIKDKLNKQQSELENVEMELKHVIQESFKSKAELEKHKLIQDENMTLKKRLLKQVNDFNDETKHLKEGFAAADEARKELESTLEVMKIENTQLKELIKDNESHDQKNELLKEQTKLLNEQEQANLKLQVQNDELQHQIEALTDEHNIGMKNDQDQDQDLDQEDDYDNDIENDDNSEIQVQKITRLQCSLKVYEAEINRLTQKVYDLEEQILNLEHKNGKLIMDGQQNLSMKHQIQKLQEEIIKDTNLRKELLSSLELAKSSLHTEIRNLEKSLKTEKDAHVETKNRLILQEHECAKIRVDRRSLRTGQFWVQSIIFRIF